MDNTKAYWAQRYATQQTGWDIGHVATPLKSYFDQLTDKTLRILIPGAGNAYEAEYLWKLGFKHLTVLDIASAPLAALKKRVATFPNQQLICNDFFTHTGVYDLIIEQTFFCSFPPTTQNRSAYAQQMANLLAPKGKLVGLWFDFPLTEDLENRPFGGNQHLYLSYLSHYFTPLTFERCYNSIPPRQNRELFGIFRKK